MLQMGLSEGIIYNLTIAPMIRSIFLFSITNGVEEYYKFELVYYLNQNFLLVYKFELYGVKSDSTMEASKPLNIATILETKAKNSLTIFLPQLVLSIQAVESFCVLFMDPLKS